MLTNTFRAHSGETVESRAQYETIYESPAALDAYLSGIRQRLEERRHERERKRHWQTAVEKVQHELTLARQEQDDELGSELEAVLRRFQELLNGTATLSGIAALPAPIAAIAPASEPLIAMPPPTAISEPKSAPVVPPASTPSAPAITPEARQARRVAMLEEIAEIEQAWKTLVGEGLRRSDGNLDRPLCFRLRALACELGSIYAASWDYGLERVADSAVEDILNEMRMTRRLENDRYESLPFDDDSCWHDPEQAMTSRQWSYLAGQYRQMGTAAEAWDWLTKFLDELTDDTKYQVLNGIAACQQALFRTLDSFEGRDRLQETFYGPIRELAKPLRFLEGLSRETNDAQIDILAQSLPRAWELGKQEAASRHEREEREARSERQHAAIAEVVSLCEREPQFGQNPDDVARDRNRLFPLLDACLDLGVPATNVTLRESLIQAAPLLLHDQPAYAKILESVLTERERRGMDVAPDSASSEDDDHPEADDPSEEAVADHVEQYKEAVRPFVAGKRVMILGGSPRTRVCDELQTALGCEEVRWPESEKTDKLAKFEADIHTADVLLIAKNFARHYMSGRKVKDLMKERGGHFLILPGGYGINQIIYRLYQYVCAEEARH